jgi:hypothetical protein
MLERRTKRKIWQFLSSRMSRKNTTVWRNPPTTLLFCSNNAELLSIYEITWDYVFIRWTHLIIFLSKKAEPGGTREKIGQSNVFKVECEWKISSVPAVDRSSDKLRCWLKTISGNGLRHGYIGTSMCLHGRR